jgi:hypothetical protein
VLPVPESFFIISLEPVVYWIFKLSILEKRTVGAAAGTAGGGPGGRQFFFYGVLIVQNPAHVSGWIV